jgi:transposase
MATVPQDEVRVTVGMDTHEDTHVAVALHQLGRWLGEAAIPTTRRGYAGLLEWACSFGVIDAFGVEGTGSWGAGLSRWLRAEGLVVIEVDRPDRKTRRHGKSDTIDAEAAARAVLSGKATTVPKTGDGPVEMIRALRMTRRSAVKNRTMTANQISSLPEKSTRLRTRRSCIRSRSALAAACEPITPTLPSSSTPVASCSQSSHPQRNC